MEKHKAPPSRWKAGGFTLLELLLVVAIIALLAALLLPVLSQARERARTVQCVDNLKQWGLALWLYSDDYGFIPREGSLTNGRVFRDSWPTVRHINNMDVWYNALPPYLDQPRASNFSSLVTGARLEFHKLRVFHCPTARFPANVGLDSYPYFSLAMNSKLIQPPIVGVPSILFSAIQKPAETVAFLDARVSTQEPKVDPNQYDHDLGQPSASASRFAARHIQGSGNLAFADGRVATRKGTTVVERRIGRRRGLAIFPDGDIYWAPDPLVDPNTQD